MIRAIVGLATAIALTLTVFTPVAAADEPRTLKLATLAPEGTLWMNLSHDLRARVEKLVTGYRSSGGAKSATVHASNHP